MKVVLLFLLCTVITAFTDEQDKAFDELLNEIIGKGKETSRDETMPEDDLLTLAQRYNAFIDNVEQQKREEEMKDLSSLTNVYGKLEEKHDEGMDKLTKLTNQYNDYTEQQQKQNNLPTMIKQYNDFVDNHQTVQEDVPVNLDDYDLVLGSPDNSPCPNGIYLSLKQVWACVKNIPEPPPKTYKVYGPTNQNPCVVNGGVWDPAAHVWICNAVNEDAPVNNVITAFTDEQGKAFDEIIGKGKETSRDETIPEDDLLTLAQRYNTFIDNVEQQKHDEEMKDLSSLTNVYNKLEEKHDEGMDELTKLTNQYNDDIEQQQKQNNLPTMIKLREKIQDDILNDDMTSIKKDFEIIEDTFNRKLSHEEKMDIFREVVTDDFVRKYKMEKDSA